MANTDEIAHRVADLLLPDLSKFRYTRSRTQLRRKGTDFSDDVIISVTTRSGTGYTLAFYTGVAHSETEKLVADLEKRKVTPYDRTVFQYSVNQTSFQQLGFEGNTWWSGLPQKTDLSEIEAEIHGFIDECALSYFDHFHDMSRMRHSLVTRDGLSLNLNPFKQVLAMDAVLKDAKHAEGFLDFLQEEVNHGCNHDVDSFNTFYELLVESFPQTFPQFKLQTKLRA